MADEKDTKLKIGEHEIHNTHSHAYAAIEAMSPVLREQLFANAHKYKDEGGVFSTHVNGKSVEYKLLHNGEIHEHHS